MSDENRAESTSAGPFFFLLVAAAFLAIGVWNLTTNVIPAGIAFIGLGLVVGVYAIAKKRARRQ